MCTNERRCHSTRKVNYIYEPNNPKINLSKFSIILYKCIALLSR